MNCPFDLDRLAQIGRAIDFSVTDISSASELEQWKTAAGQVDLGAFARAQYVPPKMGVFAVDGQAWVLYWDRRPRLCAEPWRADPPKPVQAPLFSAAYEAAFRASCPEWTPPTVASAVFGKTRNGLKFPRRGLLNYERWQALILSRDPSLSRWFDAKRITRPHRLAREWDVAAMTARVAAIEAQLNAEASAMNSGRAKRDVDAPYDMGEVEFATHLGLQRPEFHDDVRAHMAALAEYVVAWKRNNPPVIRKPGGRDEE